MLTLKSTVIFLALMLMPLASLTHAAKDLPAGTIARLGKGQLLGVHFSPDGKLLAVTSSVGIWLYDADTYFEIGLLTGHAGGVISVSFSPDGKLLASGSWDDTVKLWVVLVA